MELLSEEKEQYQAEKFEFMEKLSNEKVSLTEKVGELERKLQTIDQKFDKMKKKGAASPGWTVRNFYGNGKNSGRK